MQQRHNLKTAHFRVNITIELQIITTTTDNNGIQRILEWKPTGTRIRGRPRKRRIVDIEEGMQIIGIKG